MHAKLQEDLRGGSSSAAARSQHVQRLPPNWKNLSSSSFSFFPRLGECKRRWKRNECCELRQRRREERTLQMVSAVEKPGGGQGGNDNDKLFQQTNAIRGWPPSWLLRGQTILTPPTARKQHLAFFPPSQHPQLFAADFTSQAQTHRGRHGCHYSVLQCVLNGWNLFSIHKHCRCNTLRTSMFNRSLMRDYSLCLTLAIQRLSMEDGRM